MKSAEEIMQQLAAPFAEGELREGQGKGGRTFLYVEAPRVMDRLDQVVGIQGWRMSFREVERGVVCTIGIYFDEKGWVEKSNAGGYAGMTETVRTGPGRDDKAEIDDPENDLKSGYTDAIKRTGMVWGIGRYLWMKSATRAPATPAATTTPQGGARRSGGGEKPRTQWPGASDPGISPSRQPADAPRSGKALFGWLKDQEQRYEIGLLKYLNDWAKLQGFPGRMIDWNAEQTRLGYAEAVRKLGTLEHADAGAAGSR